MKRFISILTGSLFACISFVHAEETISPAEITTESIVAEIPSVSEAEQIINEVSNTGNTNENTGSTVAPEAKAEGDSVAAASESVVSEQPTVIPEKNTPAQKKGEKTSLWDKILSMFKASEPKVKTCEEAFSQMEGVSINFSYTSDFAQNGERFMEMYYKKIKDTNAFGTHSSNLYVDLSNLNVTTDVLISFLGKWSKTFSDDKRTVLWNLSDNKSLGDSVIDAIDLSNMYSLNLSNTEVTDLTVTKIISILNIQNTGKLVCVNLSGTKVTPEGVASLKEAFRKAKSDFEAKNVGKTYALEGDDNSGVIFQNLPQFLKPNDQIHKGETPKASTEIDVVSIQESETAPVAETPAPVAEIQVPSAETAPVAEIPAPSAEAQAPSETSASLDATKQIDEALSQADQLIKEADASSSTTTSAAETPTESSNAEAVTSVENNSEVANIVEEATEAIQ